MPWQRPSGAIAAEVGAGLASATLCSRLQATKLGGVDEGVRPRAVACLIPDVFGSQSPDALLRSASRAKPLGRDLPARTEGSVSAVLMTFAAEGDADGLAGLAVAVDDFSHVGVSRPATARYAATYGDDAFLTHSAS